MSGLILELQADALDNSVRVSDLLRKALVVSKKLDIKDVERWLEHELEGYPGDGDIPEYRKIQGEVRAWNPHHRMWIPIIFEDETLAGLLSSKPIHQAVAEIDSLLESKAQTLQVTLSAVEKKMLIELMEVPLEPAFQIPRTAVVGVLDAVRNKILQWALELEKSGILGEGMTFSKEEKKAASQVTYQTTNNIGSMTNSQLQQHSSGAQTMDSTADLAELLALVKALTEASVKVVDGPTRAELLAEIQTLKSQADSPKPKKSIIAESLRSVRTILEGAAGNLVASDLPNKVSALLHAYGLSS